jgi:hypothetical protein
MCFYLQGGHYPERYYTDTFFRLRFGYIQRFPRRGLSLGYLTLILFIFHPKHALHCRYMRLKFYLTLTFLNPCLG